MKKFYEVDLERFVFQTPSLNHTSYKARVLGNPIDSTRFYVPSNVGAQVRRAKVFTNLRGTIIIKNRIKVSVNVPVAILANGAIFLDFPRRGYTYSTLNVSTAKGYTSLYAAMVKMLVNMPGTPFCLFNDTETLSLDHSRETKYRILIPDESILPDEPSRYLAWAVASSDREMYGYFLACLKAIVTSQKEAIAFFRERYPKLEAIKIKTPEYYKDAL